jgi:hypothetical protein
MSFPRRALACLAIVAFACASDPPPPTVLQALDLKPLEGLPFDPQTLIDSDEALLDKGAISKESIDLFFEKTPYGRPSFLGTYSSNGVRAADAIVRAAQKYDLNPLIFLVRLQASQGLIGERYYPSDANRVEYVFGCGCNGRGTCDAAYAGLDKQLNCFGNALHTSVEQILRGNGLTDGGWGPGQVGLTYDGAKLTPTNAATAALYQYEPILAQGKGGAWLVWNLWNRYAAAASYAQLASSGGAGSIGQSCAGGTCAKPEYQCLLDAPGPLCTVRCQGSCPTGSACVFFGAGSYCLGHCEVPGRNDDCRGGYDCRAQPLTASPTGATAPVCVPR